MNIGTLRSSTGPQTDQRYLSFLDRRAWYAVLIAPAALWVVLVAAYGVSVPVQDSWAIVHLLSDVVAGKLTLAILWAPHNESRMLTANLIFLTLGLPTQYNGLADMYFSAGSMLLAAILMSTLALRSGGLRGAWLSPIFVLLLSPIQVGNLLWDFQLPWLLVVLLLGACLWCLELVPNHRFLLAAAAVLAIAASFCALQGLLLWPSGLLYAWSRGLRRGFLVQWLCLGAATFAIYFWRLGQVEPRAWSSFTFHHPLQALDYLLRLAGNIVPAHNFSFGAVLVTAAVLVLAACLVAPHWRQRLRLPAALLIFGLAFDAIDTYGRAALNSPLSSRYTTYSLVLAVGLYLAAAIACRDWLCGAAGARAAKPLPLLALALALLGAGAQASLGIPNGLALAHATYSGRRAAAYAVRHYRTESDSALQRADFALGGQYVKAWAPALQQNHWSVFAGGK